MSPVTFGVGLKLRRISTGRCVLSTRSVALECARRSSFRRTSTRRGAVLRREFARIDPQHVLLVADETREARGAGPGTRSSAWRSFIAWTFFFLRAHGELFEVRVPVVDALEPAPAPRAILEHGHVLAELGARRAQSMRSPGPRVPDTSGTRRMGERSLAPLPSPERDRECRDEGVRFRMLRSSCQPMRSAFSPYIQPSDSRRRKFRT